MRALRHDAHTATRGDGVFSCCWWKCIRARVAESLLCSSLETTRIICYRGGAKGEKAQTGRRRRCNMLTPSLPCPASDAAHHQTHGTRCRRATLLADCASTVTVRGRVVSEQCAVVHTLGPQARAAETPSHLWRSFNCLFHFFLSSPCNKATLRHKARKSVLLFHFG